MNTDIVKSLEKYRKGWTGGLPETQCGHGSLVSVTEKQRQWLPEMFAKYKIKSIADIGAGDLNWIKHMDLGEIEYTPYDLVPRHPSVTQFDLLQEVPPKVDLIMCLWVLNHLDYDDCARAIDNLLASKSKYLIMTDRPKWHAEQPESIQMKFKHSLTLNNKGDRMLFIKL